MFARGLVTRGIVERFIEDQSGDDLAIRHGSPGEGLGEDLRSWTRDFAETLRHHAAGVVRPAASRVILGAARRRPATTGDGPLDRLPER